MFSGSEVRLGVQITGKRERDLFWPGIRDPFFKKKMYCFTHSYRMFLREVVVQDDALGRDGSVVFVCPILCDYADAFRLPHAADAKLARWTLVSGRTQRTQNGRCRTVGGMCPLRGNAGTLDFRLLLAELFLGIGVSFLFFFFQ